MKKYFNNRQIALSFIVLIAIILIATTLTGLGVQAIAYADNITQSSDEIYYAATTGSSKETESFSYATKTTESYSVNPTFPDYHNSNDSLTNTCANVAGAHIIGYYDRYYDNLIPDVTVGYVKNGKYTYYPMKVNMTAFQNVINDLYQRMGTNIVGEGNSQDEYKNGLKSYVQSKGLSISFSSVMTSSAFDFEKAKAQLQNGNPISLYMSKYNITTVIDDGNTVTMEKRLYDANHIAIAYGYEKVIYFDSNGKAIKTEIYLRVSTGIVGITGVYVVNKYGKLNDAEGVHIS